MISATKKEFLCLSAAQLALAVFFLVPPAYVHAQDEPPAGAAATTMADSADRANTEVTLPDSVAETVPAPGRSSPDADDEKDDSIVSSSLSPGDLSSADLLEESQKMTAGERYPEALEYALFAVEREDSSEDPYNPDLIEPLINLASSQRKLQLDRQAAESLDRAIDLIERDGGIYDARLVTPINRAGRLLQQRGEHGQAIELFRRSQHISHRVDGVFSTDQVAALELMTRSYLTTGDLDAANATQNFRYKVDIHRFGWGSILTIPSRVALARFKTSLRLYDDARKLYVEAIQITEDSLGENDLALVDLLLGLASVRQNQRDLQDYHRARAAQLRRDTSVAYYDYRPQASVLSSDQAKKTRPPARIQGASPGQALAALNRAVQIVDHHQEKVSCAYRFDIYVNLGDTYMLLKKRDRGITTYQQAIELLDSASNAQELKEQYFGRPFLLQYKKPRPLPNAVGRYTNYDGTFAEASFVVRANGSVGEVELVASNAPVPMRTLFRREVRRSIYRPRFVDGEPVATAEHLREEFVGTALAANAKPAGN